MSTPPPKYNVSDYLPDKVGPKPDGKRAIEIAQDLQCHVFRLPSTALLPPEIIIRDFTALAWVTGNGFDVLMGYIDGPEVFIRGLNAMRALGLNEHASIMEEAKQVIERYGLIFPDPLPDPWNVTDDDTDFELDPNFIEDMREINDRYWDVDQGETACMALLRFVERHQDVLACRA